MQAETGNGEGMGVPDVEILCWKYNLTSPQDMLKGWDPNNSRRNFDRSRKLQI